jgi:hypothetical protein
VSTSLRAPAGRWLVYGECMKLRLLLGLLLAVCLSPWSARAEAQTPVPASAWQSTPAGKADAWVLFEQQRDRHTRRGEKIFYPLSLGLLAAAGTAFAVTSDVPTGARIAWGVAGAASAAALLPTMLSVSRDSSRAWFTAGMSAFLVAAGTGLAIVDAKANPEDEDSLRESGCWIGASVALQGLALLPIGFIAGFPKQHDYDLYWKLPAEARPQAAARILRQIDRFEQRATAISLLSSLAGAVALSIGVLVVDNGDARKEVAAFSLAPLTGALLGVVPRPFAGSRLEHLATGEPPRRMAFNAW